jgi:hypothetical protein
MSRQYTVLALALSLLCSVPAHAANYQWSGAFCRSPWNVPQNTTSGRLYFSVEHGVTNANPQYGELIECGLGATPAVFLDITAATVYFTDRSPTTTLLCYVRSSFGPGYTYYSAPRSSCSTAGGCASNPDLGFTGQSYLSWTDPLNNGNGFIYASAGFFCVLPGGPQGSSLHAYVISTP